MGQQSIQQNSKMRTIELGNGTSIRDNRDINCGVSIENQNRKYIDLCYSSTLGVFLNIKGAWITEDELKIFKEELNSAQISLEIINRLLNEEKV